MYITQILRFAVMYKLMAFKVVLVNIMAVCVTADKLVKFAGFSVELLCSAPVIDLGYGAIVTYNWTKGSEHIAKYSVQHRDDTLHPQHQWFHESLGARLASASTKLRIYDLKQSDGGNYTCTTTCSNGHAKKESILIVKDRPNMDIRSVKPAGAFLATCTSEVDSSEKLRVFWKMGDKDLPGEMKLHISAAGMSTITVDLIVPRHLMTSHPNSLREKFTCVAKIAGKTYESRPYVSRIPHPPTDVNITGERIIREGNRLFLTCDAPAYPKSTYVWKLAGKEVATGYEYRVQKVSRDMAGPYSCHAVNEIGQSSKEIEIIVNFPPERVKITRDRTTDTLKCEVVGGCRPAPKFSWIMKNGEKISGNKSTLTMSHKPVGIYQCIAENDLGESRAKFEWTPEFEASAQIANTKSWIYAVVGVGVAVFVVTAVLVFLGRKHIRRVRLCWNTYVLNDGSSCDNRSQGLSVSSRHSPQSAHEQPDTSSSSVRHSPSVTDQARESPSQAASQDNGESVCDQLQWNDRNSVTVTSEMLRSRAEGAPSTRPYGTMPVRMRERGERAMMRAYARDDYPAPRANACDEPARIHANPRHGFAVTPADMFEELSSTLPNEWRACDAGSSMPSPMGLLARDRHGYAPAQPRPLGIYVKTLEDDIPRASHEFSTAAAPSIGGDGNISSHIVV